MEQNQKDKDILDNLIPAYAENKREMDDYKAICDKQNLQIKELLATIKDGEYIVGGYKAKRIVSEKESVNEELLLSLFTSVPGFVKIADEYCIVKTRPYIDFDALEKAMYDGVMSNEQVLELAKATDVKEIVSLRVTKIKEKK